MIGYANVMDSFQITSKSIHRTDKKNKKHSQKDEKLVVKKNSGQEFGDDLSVCLLNILSKVSSLPN